MGALAPVSHWLPQDDLLLKNAVEAGASLEALAKGAVQFSQRFSVQELQDRWYSLLYDPVISAEASRHMIELECSVSTAKFNKEAKCISGKRRADSVRKYYYSMRKRICSEPCDSIGVGFLGGPGFFSTEKHHELFSVDCFLGDEAVPDVFDIQESNFDIKAHTFPELQATGTGSCSDDVSTSAFCTGLYDNDECKSLCQGAAPLKNCSSFDDDIHLTSNQNIVKEFTQSSEMQACDLFETMDLDIEPPIFDEINEKEGNMHSAFESKVYSSPPSVCGTSLPNFGYSSALPQMPSWSEVEGLGPCTLPEINGETKDHAGNDLVTPGDFDSNGGNIPGLSSVDSNPELKCQVPSAVMKDSVTNAEEYFAELSNSLLNFTAEDDFLFMDADGKDVIEKSYIENLSSLLLDSPDTGCTPDLGISEVIVAPNVCLSSSPISAHPGESVEQGQGCCDNQHVVWSVEAQKLSSALTVNPSFPELRNGVIFCALNTEDTEIPNNDDVFLPIRLPSTSSISHTKFDESYSPDFPSIEFSYTQEVTDRTIMKSEQSNYSQLHVPLQMKRPSSQLGMGLFCQIDDLQVKLEPQGTDVQHVTHRKVTTCECPALVNAVYSSDKSLGPGSRKQLQAKIEQPNYFLNHTSCDCHIEKQVQASDPHLRFQTNTAGSMQDIDSASNIQNHEALHAEFCYVENTGAEAITGSIVSDPEELSCESGDDVPYFSDIEAMILDMDLSPDDQGLNCRPGVLKYQREDARRMIIRLEQAADASLQRMLSAHGAYAVLYGRRSRHFVKKTEVLLGRATEDFNVDIDLGMECHANRISRRQATIKMGTNGSFHLTNHGKFSIFVNGREVIPKENIALVSGCLIEVRGLPFIFETNRTSIKRFLGGSGNESQSWEHKD